jgi:hypothetical protein
MKKKGILQKKTRSTFFNFEICKKIAVFFNFYKERANFNKIKICSFFIKIKKQMG